MADKNRQAKKPSSLEEMLRAIGPWVSAGIILIGYAWLIRYLLGKTTLTDEEWVKLTYIFSSVEAIVFTAVGFIFGREVNRSRALVAESKEEKTRKEKDRLAKEILDKLPVTPGIPTNINTSQSDLIRLRTLAEIHIK